MILDIEYQLLGQEPYLHTEKSNDDLEVVVKEIDNRHIVTIKAKKDIVLTRGRIDGVHTFDVKDVFPTNGYQSWTDTTERTIKEKSKEKNVKKLPKFLLKTFSFDKYGDSTFYPYKKNTLHGYNIFYVKGVKELFSFNYNYEKAYVIYEINTKTKTLQILSDVYGQLVKKGESAIIYDLYYCFDYEQGYRDFAEAFHARSNDKIFGYTSWYNYYQNINESIILMKKYNDREDLIKKLSRISSYKVHGHACTSSLGISILNQDANTFSKLFKQADTALYEAKRIDKPIVFYSDIKK